MPRKRPEDHLPLKAVHHMVLLVLAQEPTYGVALMERLEERSDGAIRLNAGSLYRIIGSLVDDGLVEPAGETEGPTGPGAPRKTYAVTEAGLAVLRAEAVRQEGLLEMARTLDLLEERR